MFSSFRSARAALLSAALATLAACSSAPPPKFQQELFDTGASPFSRHYNVGSNDACEAVRRALLNQGYLTNATSAERIDATKDFQPSGDSHITVEFHVVCTPGEDADGTSIVYANAIQSGYALKKSDTSASVGLSLLGSVSLPIRSNSDAMVKVSSETIQTNAFYDRFFDSVSHYVGTLIKTAPVPVASVTTSVLRSAPPPIVAAAPPSSVSASSVSASSVSASSVSASSVSASSAPASSAWAPSVSAAPASPASSAAAPAPGLPAPSAALSSPYALPMPAALPSQSGNAPAPAASGQAPIFAQPPSAQPAPGQAASQ
jgi:hypothetical protein